MIARVNLSTNTFMVLSQSLALKKWDQNRLKAARLGIMSAGEDATQPLHFILQIRKAENISALRMRRLFGFVELHPGIELIPCGAVWCNRDAIDLNMGVSLSLTSLSPLTLAQVKLRFLLKSSAAVNSASVVYAEIPLPPDPIFPEIVSVRELIDDSSGSTVGSLSVAVAVRVETDSQGSVPELKFRQTEGTDWKTAAMNHNWRSIAYVQKNWKDMAQHFGWRPPPPHPPFKIQRGDHLTIEIGHRPDPLDLAIVAPRPDLYILPRFARSAVLPRMTIYAMIQKLHLEPDFDEKRTREYRSQRGSGFPRLVADVESSSDPQPSTFDPREQIEALLDAPLAPRFSVASDVVYDFPGFRPSAPCAISPVVTIDVPRNPRIFKSPSLERMLDAAGMELLFDVSDSTDEYS